jgi:hypothetical protein
MEKGKGNPAAVCPWCDHKLDGYTAVGGARGDDPVPREGDFSLCVNCRQVLVFRADQTVRKCTDKEAKEFTRWWKAHKRELRRKMGAARAKKMN